MEPEIPHEITERVQRGALLLDATVPNWAARIDTDFLALSCCTRCVLGQLFGDYLDGARALGWSVLEASLTESAFHLVVAHGFSTGGSPIHGWITLRAAWIVEINRRLPKPAKPTRPTRRKRTVAVAVPVLCTV